MLHCYLSGPSAMQLDDTVDIEVLAQFEQWVMVKGKEEQPAFGNALIFIVWLHNAEPPDAIIHACHKLASINDLFPDFNLAFEQKPKFGFVLRSKKGWGFETPELTQKTLEKIIWELNRLSRG